jgi:hypothetical protein
MHVRAALLAVSLAVYSPTPTSAADPAANPSAYSDAVCSGKVSGAVQGDFTCVVTTVKKAAGQVTFEIKPDGPVKGLKSLVPGTFVIREPLSIQSYTHDDLVSATSSAVTTSGKKFSASKNPGVRSDFSVAVESMERSRTSMFGTMRVHSHLVPADSKDKAEIVVDVQFSTRW